MCQSLFRFDIVVQCGTDTAFQRDPPHLFVLVAMKSKQFHYGHRTLVITYESSVWFESNLLALFLNMANLQMYKTAL